METVPVSTSEYLSPVFFWPLVTIATILLVVYYYIETSRIVKMGNKLPGKSFIRYN
jgi:hypothetical protein